MLHEVEAAMVLLFPGDEPACNATSTAAVSDSCIVCDTPVWRLLRPAVGNRISGSRMHKRIPDADRNMFAHRAKSASENRGG